MIPARVRVETPPAERSANRRTPQPLQLIELPPQERALVLAGAVRALEGYAFSPRRRRRPLAPWLVELGALMADGRSVEEASEHFDLPPLEIIRRLAALVFAA